MRTSSWFLGMLLALSGWGCTAKQPKPGTKAQQISQQPPQVHPSPQTEHEGQQQGVVVEPVAAERQQAFLADCKKIEGTELHKALLGALNVSACTDAAPLLNATAVNLDTLANSQNLAILTHFQKAESVGLLAAPALKDISALEKLPNLKNLTIASAPKLTQYTPLANLPKLEHLVLIGTSVRNLDFLSKATSLKDLQIADVVGHLEDVGGLKGVPQLERLQIAFAQLERPQITFAQPAGAPRNLSALSALKNLQRLSLVNMGLNDTNMLQGLTHLAVVNLSGNKIQNITGLAGLTEIEELNLSGKPARKNIIELFSSAVLKRPVPERAEFSSLRDLSPLKNLLKLQKLSVSLNRIENIEPLRGLPLIYLDMASNSVKDFSPLSGKTNLNLLMQKNQTKTCPTGIASCYAD